MARLGLKLCITLLSVLLAGGGCSKRGGTDPVPQRYRLYVGARAGPLTGEGTYVLSVDCDDDMVLDSLPLDEQFDIHSVQASPDGRFLAVRKSVLVDIFDLRSNMKLLTLPEGDAGVFFPSAGDVALGTGGSATRVFSLPSFEVIGTIPVRLTGAQQLPEDSLVIAIYVNRDGMDRPISSGFLIANFRTGVVIDSIWIDPVMDGIGFFPQRFSLSLDGERIYALGADAQGFWLLGYDLGSRTIKFRHPYDASGGLGYCSVTPNRSEVWFSHGGNMFLIPWRQSIHIIDEHSGVLLDTIDLSGQRLSFPSRIVAMQIEFEPQQNKAYVACGASFTGPQPVVVVDVESRQIQSLLFADTSRVPHAIDLTIAP